MRVYYIDDSGNRSSDTTRPFFVLGGFGIDSDQLAHLQAVIRDTTTRFGLSLKHPCELKFNNVGRSKDSERKPNWMVRVGLQEFAERRALVYACLDQLAQVPTVKLLAVAVDKRLTYGVYRPIQHAIEPFLERVEYDCADHSTHGLVICDEEEADDKALRQQMREGSLYVRFNRIADTLSFMPSSESIGIQLADLVAGSVGRYLNHSDPGYMRHVWPAFRANAIGRVNGFGIKIYPHGTCQAPPQIPTPWPPSDRKVHEVHMARLGYSVTWQSDGTPVIVPQT